MERANLCDYRRHNVQVPDSQGPAVTGEYPGSFSVPTRQGCSWKVTTARSNGLDERRAGCWLIYYPPGPTDPALSSAVYQDGPTSARLRPHIRSCKGVAL